MNTTTESNGSNRQPDEADLRVEYFLRSLEPTRQAIGDLVDNMVKRFASLPGRIEQMRTEVLNGDILPLRDLVVTHATMTPEERRHAKIQNLRTKTIRSIHSAAPGIN